MMICDELIIELVFSPKELENLRKQAEIIPQLMAECESITEKLQVRSKQPEIPPKISHKLCVL